MPMEAGVERSRTMAQGRRRTHGVKQSRSSARAWAALP
ncbi:hypothetical protein A176_007082 [Myxococcus hansupus]|uniref:Uncharacterized protein n=1 Tax=Pseudomyxococcus hansupus TaxID=1297742 RepID=A0A0H4X9D0_9BACT|nr:hypothetical protein A176_007082 [Myxococcus hansupus]